MQDLLWLIPSMPFAGFLLLGLLGRRMPRGAVAAVGVGSIGLSALSAALVAAGFWAAPDGARSYTQTLWTWIAVGSFQPGIAFHLDALSLLMVLVVTFVAFFIHLYSAEFMSGDDGYGRFFAYMNLFVGFMLTLVLADNLVLLYLGWEGVGLCSYLLIGFWYKDSANGRAAQKAFIVTRMGDVAMALGLFLLYQRLGTLQIQELMRRAAEQWPPGSGVALAAAALLLGGALGKSAQLPLQTWLPDAMAGPTPVSALIHAATMVTAGVYLIARVHVLFQLAPAVQGAVAWIGAATLLLAGFSALTQKDIKRVLAYSTISQIGYMFLALGVGAWPAAMFHFMTHAFFKALLFLGAGSVIIAMHHEHDMFKMGGLRHQMPLTFWTFLAGSAALAAIPLITAGFYSKDLILDQVWFSNLGGRWLWAAGLLGAFLTAVYTFRMVFLTFFGEARQKAARKAGGPMATALCVLAFLSLAGGFVELPRTLGNLPLFSRFIETVLPAPALAHESLGAEFILQAVSAVTALSGVLVAFLLFLKWPGAIARWVATRPGHALHRWWFAGWGFDWLYDRLFVRPYEWLARIDREDVVDSVYDAAAWSCRLGHDVLGLTETGRVRWYAAGIALGAAALLAITVLS